MRSIEHKRAIFVERAQHEVEGAIEIRSKSDFLAELFEPVGGVGTAGAARNVAGEHPDISVTVEVDRLHVEHAADRGERKLFGQVELELQPPEPDFGLAKWDPVAACRLGRCRHAGRKLWGGIGRCIALIADVAVMPAGNDQPALQQENRIGQAVRAAADFRRADRAVILVLAVLDFQIGVETVAVIEIER